MAPPHRAAIHPVGADPAMTEARSGGAWRDLWGARRARLWIAACALAAWLPALGVPFRGWLDFSAFYVAARFVGSADVSRLEPVVRFQAEHGLPITPFVYPAGIALAYVPLTLLPYGLAGLVHVVLMFLILLAALRLGADLFGLPTRWAMLGGLAWAPAAAGVLSGQNTSAALLLVMLAAAALRPVDPARSPDASRSPSTARDSVAATRRSESIAGALVIVLANKPQLAAPLWGLFFLRQRWLALVIAVIGGMVFHYATGVVATGGNALWPLDWLDTLRTYTVEDFRANSWQAVSLPAFLARMDLLLGATGFPVLAMLGFVVGGLVVLASLRAMRQWDAPSAIALACAAGLVISPHAWVYHATLLLPGIALFARRAWDRGWPWQDRWLLALAYALAVIWPLGGLVGFVPLLAVVTAAPLVLLGIGPLAQFGRAEGKGTTPAGAV
jgi:uncharacterized membrane protein YhaH (DUF805 family)